MARGTGHLRDDDFERLLARVAGRHAGVAVERQRERAAHAAAASAAAAGQSGPGRAMT